MTYICLVYIFLKLILVSLLSDQPQTRLDFSNDYSHCNASLRVNKTLAMSGNQPTWLSLKTKEKSIENIWLHLGNVSPQAPLALINDLPIGGQGFTGCLHSMKINNEPINIFR